MHKKIANSHEFKMNRGRLWVDGMEVDAETRRHIEYIQKNFGLTLAQIYENPRILTIDIDDPRNPHSLAFKLEYYTREFGPCKQIFHKSPILLHFDCTNSGTTSCVPEKLKYLHSLGIAPSDIKKAPLILSLDCNPESTSPTSVRVKLENLSKMGITATSYLKYPIILCMDCDPNSTNPTSVAQKLKFYEQEFDFGPQQIASFPRLLGLDCAKSKNPTAVLNKRDFYLNEVGLSLHDLQRFPHLLGYDCDKYSTASTAIPQKINLAKTNGIDLQIFRDFPIVLGVPTESIKIRYMLYRLADIDKIPHTASIFIQNERKTYARFAYLHDELGRRENFRQIALDEAKFMRRVGVSSEDLMEKYPLDRAAIKRIEADYHEKIQEENQIEESQSLSIS